MTVRFRPATLEDVPAVVEMLSDDSLGATRESSDLETYREAFRAMQAEGGNTLLVGETEAGIVATYQLTFISGLSLKATRRAQIESVRVASSARGQGIGVQIMADAEARARAAGCGLLQLTTNKVRDRAQDFYTRSGFTPSHIGYKRTLD